MNKSPRPLRQALSAGSSVNEHLQVVLPNGHTVGYAQYGLPDGAPVLFFHGWPASRLQGRIAASTAQREGVRLLALDRPGIGRSDPWPARTIAGYPGLIAAFADRLGIDAWTILAVSGGGPYALACACALPERVLRVTVACGAPPAEVLLANRRLPRGMALLRATYRTAPSVIPGLLALLGWVVRRLPLTRLLGLWAHGLPAPDRAVLADSELRRVVTESTREAFRQGSEGPYHDIRLLLAPWGFDLDALAVPVRMAYGDRDTVTPLELCAPMLDGRSNVTVAVWPGEGHYSLPLRHAGALLAALLSPRA